MGWRPLVKTWVKVECIVVLKDFYNVGKINSCIELLRQIWGSFNQLPHIIPNVANKHTCISERTIFVPKGQSTFGDVHTTSGHEALHKTFNIIGVRLFISSIIQQDLS